MNILLFPPFSVCLIHKIYILLDDHFGDEDWRSGKLLIARLNVVLIGKSVLLVNRL